MPDSLAGIHAVQGSGTCPGQAIEAYGGLWKWCTHTRVSSMEADWGLLMSGESRGTRQSGDSPGSNGWSFWMTYKV